MTWKEEKHTFHVSTVPCKFLWPSVTTPLAFPEIRRQNLTLLASLLKIFSDWAILGWCSSDPGGRISLLIKPDGSFTSFKGGSEPDLALLDDAG